MKNEVAKFMMQQIDERIAKRKRRLDLVLEHKLNLLRFEIDGGRDITGADEEILKNNYGRFTDPTRLKWGHAVRPR